MPACFFKTRRLCPSSLCRGVVYNKTESWETVHHLCYDLLLLSKSQVLLVPKERRLFKDMTYSRSSKGMSAKGA